MSFIKNHQLNLPLMRKIILLSLLGLVTLSYSSTAQTIVGKWKAIENKKPSSIIQIYKGSNGKYYGKMVELLDPKLKNHTCDDCKGERNGKAMQNLVVIRDLQIAKDKKSAKGGKILDPWSGKEYNCKVWVDGTNRLKMRAFIGILFGTRTWYKVN
ncbi:MAG: DUF2147 domain-containing protein [Bacteroidota bacterium]